MTTLPMPAAGAPCKLAHLTSGGRQAGGLTTFTFATNEYRGGNNERTSVAILAA
jgi:hypothetical protein